MIVKFWLCVQQTNDRQDTFLSFVFSTTSMNIFCKVSRLYKVKDTQLTLSISCQKAMVRISSVMRNCLLKRFEKVKYD